MTPLALTDFVNIQGQEDAAKHLGISQAAVSKALKARRIIFVVPGCTGAYDALEVKAFPAPTAKATQAPDRETIMAHVLAVGQHLHGSVQASSTEVES